MSPGRTAFLSICIALLIILVLVVVFWPRPRRHVVAVHRPYGGMVIHYHAGRPYYWLGGVRFYGYPTRQHVLVYRQRYAPRRSVVHSRPAIGRGTSRSFGRGYAGSRSFRGGGARFGK